MFPEDRLYWLYEEKKYINIKIWEVVYDTDYTFVLMDILIRDFCRKIDAHIFHK